jgi:hypothetical protein
MLIFFVVTECIFKVMQLCYNSDWYLYNIFAM